MERTCARHPGTFCFSRPIYADGSARPVQLEFGVLRMERTLRVDLFENDDEPDARCAAPPSHRYCRVIIRPGVDPQRLATTPSPLPSRMPTAAGSAFGERRGREGVR